MANKIIAVQYTSANGTLFSTGLDEELFDTGDVGGTALAANHTLPPLPRQMKPRRAVVQSAAGYTREIIALTAAAPIMTIGNETTVEDSDGVAHTVVTIGTKSESFRRRRQQGTP